MPYVIKGPVVRYKNGIPVVRDEDVKKQPKGYKGITYRQVASLKTQSKGIHKKTGAVGKAKAKQKLQKPKDDKPKKLNAFQLFNLAIKEKKKDKTFRLTVDDRKEKWARAKKLLQKNKMKPTKKDFRTFVENW